MLPVMRVGKQARWTEDLPIRACRKMLKPHFPLHWHEFFEIELIISGHGHCTLNGKPYDLNPGDLYLLTTTDFHEVYADNIEVLHLTFDQSMIDAGMTEKIISVGENLFFHLDNKEYEKFYSYMSLIIEECALADSYRKDFVSHLMQCIFILMLRKVDFKETEKSKHCPPIAAAIAYLELHFRESPDLQTVADHVHLNKNYFCSLFREETGKTMVRYTNASGNGKTLLVVRDSFAVFMMPYFNNHFSECYYVHMSAYNPGMIEEYDPDYVVYETVERYIEGAKNFYAK